MTKAIGKETEHEDKAQSAPKEGSREWYDELVTVNLIKDSNAYKDDVVVIYNGTAQVIPRGKSVRVRRGFALILEEAQKQRGLAANVASGASAPAFGGREQ